MGYSTITQLVKDGDDLYYVACHPEIENCIADGTTAEEARKNLAEVTEMILEHLREHHLPIPSPAPIIQSPEELTGGLLQKLSQDTLTEPDLKVIELSERTTPVLATA